MGKRWPRSPVNCKWESFQCPSYPTSTFYYLPPLATRKGATFTMLLWTTQWLLDWLDRGSPLHAQHAYQSGQVTVLALVSLLLILHGLSSNGRPNRSPIICGYPVSTKHHHRWLPSCSVFCQRASTKRQLHVSFQKCDKSRHVNRRKIHSKYFPPSTKLLHVSDMIK